jgi:hypothetical protein
MHPAREASDPRVRLGRGYRGRWPTSHRLTIRPFHEINVIAPISLNFGRAPLVVGGRE